MTVQSESSTSNSYCHACQARHEGAWSSGVVFLRGQMPRAASNGGTVPRGGVNKSLTTDTPVVGLRS